MEAAAAATSSSHAARSLTRRPSSSASFKLRCPSLNYLRLRRIFEIFDTNQDGMVSVEEINQALGLLGLDVEITELENIIRTFIQPGHEALAFDDFVGLHQSLYDTFFFDGDEEEDIGSKVEEAALVVAVRDEEKEKKRNLMQEESDLREAFKVFDEDGDGFISAKELQTVLGKLGFSEGKEIDRVERMISSVDRNHDGLVDLFEFKDMMRRTILGSSSLLVPN